MVAASGARAAQRLRAGVVVCAIAALASACASHRGPAATLPATTARAAVDYGADFDQLVKELADGYAYLDERKIDLDEVRRRLEPRVRAVKDDDAFIALLEEVIDALHDAHANLHTNLDHSFRLVPTDADVWADDVNGQAVIAEVRPGSAAAHAGLRAGQEIVAISGVPVREAIDARLGPHPAPDPGARGWALRSLLAGRHDEPRRLTLASAEGPRKVTLTELAPIDHPPPLEARRLPSGVGYIDVHNNLGDDDLVPAFDAALGTLAACPALILDLRDTPSGGNTGVAEAILGRFVHEPRRYQRHELPKAGWRGRSRIWEQYVTPRGAIYDGRVVVLVDHWTGSMGEGMAIGFDGMKRGTVVGTPMAGLNGAVYSSTLAKSGIGFSYPAERLFHIDGTPRQAWVPPVRIALVGHDGAGEDAILERGEAVVKGR